MARQHTHREHGRRTNCVHRDWCFLISLAHATTHTCLLSAVFSARLETPPSVTHYSLGSHAFNISADKAAVSADGSATLAIPGTSQLQSRVRQLSRRRAMVRRCDELIFAEACLRVRACPELACGQQLHLQPALRTLCVLTINRTGVMGLVSPKLVWLKTTPARSA